MPIVPINALDGAFDVIVVGAGPAGLTCAFECRSRGLRVLLLDAGGRRPVPGDPDILSAEICGNAHDPVEIVAASALGGTSHWWGGRAVTLDPVDMRSWPISWSELKPWWERAADLLGAARAQESDAPGKFASLEHFQATWSESWAPDPILSRHWRDRIRAADGPAIVLGVRVTGFEFGNGRIAGVHVRTQSGVRTVRSAHTILAAGGLGGMRLLLLAQQADPCLFGGPGGPLGRGYMGHLGGTIANIVLDNPADIRAFQGCKQDGRSIVRRRILPRDETVTSEGIGNIAFWLGKPELSDPSHGSAGASARFLAATGVRLLAGKRTSAPLAPHFSNVGQAPFAAAAELGNIAWAMATVRLAKQRHAPRPILSSGGHGWRLVYHAEQKNDPRNRISLSAQKDSIGLPKLHIDFRFHEHDVGAVVLAHDLLDADLRKAGAGHLRWTAIADRDQSVMLQARDGYHQIGGAAMSSDPADGVVDRDCRVHGFENLWVASSSVFPTSGQANPTLTIIALALRIADRIAAAPKTTSAVVDATAFQAAELLTAEGNNAESQQEQTRIVA